MVGFTKQVWKQQARNAVPYATQKLSFNQQLNWGWRGLPLKTIQSLDHLSQPICGARHPQSHCPQSHCRKVPCKILLGDMNRPF